MPEKTKLLLEEYGRERVHRTRLRNLANSSSGPIRVASAYVTNRDMMLECDNRERQLLTSLTPMDIASGATSLESLRSLLDAGVEIRVAPSTPKLHAKAYIFGNDHAVVTSANLTRNAFESNLEVGVEIEKTEIEPLISWFNRVWIRSATLQIDDLASLWEQTSTLRHEYVKLKKTATTKLHLKNTAKNEYSGSIDELLSSAKRFFLLNTNRRYDNRTETGGFGLEEKMFERGLSTVWEKFNYPSHMEEIERGDAVFAFAKSIGIIGIGIASSGCEVIDGNSEDRLWPPEQHDSPEWRVPTRWLMWVDEADALPYPEAPNASFINVSGSNYAELRNAIAKHFLNSIDSP